MSERIIIKASRADLPMLRDRYPFVYLEHGRLEVDDSSIKWISADREIFRIPVATVSTLLLGPGTSVTHGAIKILAETNCSVCWVGEDSLRFYAVGQSPTATTYNLKKQISLATDSEKSLEVAKRMFAYRFPEEEISCKKLKELMTLEGTRIKQLYIDLAEKYSVGWHGRSYKVGAFQLSDITNQLITSSNTALYALVSSIIHSLGLSPHIGFIHSGSPLPFVYDIADLYKADLVFDLSFALTREMAGIYNRAMALSAFRKKVIEFDFMKKCPADIINLLGLKK